MAAARNRGIEESSGRYLTLLDRDDLWAPEKLEKQVAVLEGQPAIGMVITNVVHIDRNGRSTGEVAQGYNPDDDFYRLFVKGYVPTPSSTMIRRTVLQQAGGFCEAFRSAGLDDHELWPRIAAISEVANIAEPLTFHRQSYAKPKLVALKHRRLLIKKKRRTFSLTPDQSQFILGMEAAYLAERGQWLLGKNRFHEGRTRLMQGGGLGSETEL